MKNNKGFSLVELIIVIAIMAILVGVMAPQLIKYIEKTNVSADTQLCDSVRTALTTACLDPDVVKAGGTIADSTGGSDITNITNADVKAAAEEILGMQLSAVSGKLKSKNAKGSGVNYKKSGSQIQVYCAGDTTIYSGYIN